MSNLSSAINRAKKLVKERERANNKNANRIIVTEEFNQELNGELVIVLYTK